MQKSHKPTAVLALFLSTFGWALAPIFIRYLSTSYDVNTQNFIRYLGATLPLLIISLVWYREEFRLVLKHRNAMLGIGLVNIFQQWSWTIGCAGSTATTAQLISKTSIVFVIALSFFLFHEERAVIRSRLYQAGTFLSLLGLVAVISRDPSSILPHFDIPTVMLIFTSIMWAVYTIWGKHLVSTVHPVPMFTVIAIGTTIASFIMACIWGNPANAFTAGPSIFWIAIISGIVCIAISHPTFHFAQKHLGSALCSSVALLNPLVTYFIALCIWPDEKLILTQWFGAAALLAGTLLVTYAGHQVHEGQTGQEKNVC